MNYPEVENKIKDEIKKKLLIANPGWFLKII